MHSGKQIATRLALLLAFSCSLPLAALAEDQPPPPFDGLELGGQITESQSTGCSECCMDIVFLVDTTSSLSVLATVRSQLAAVINTAASCSASTGSNLRVGLITFKDVVSVVSPLTTSYSTVQSSLLSLSSGGGNFTPEASDEALRKLLFNTSSCASGSFSTPFNTKCRKLAILVTDAEPGGCNDIFDGGDISNAHAMAVEAAARGIRIIAVQVGSSSVSRPIMQDYATTTNGAYIETSGDGLANAITSSAPFTDPCGDLLRADSNNNGQVERTNNPEDCNANPNADDCIENAPGLNKGLLLPINNNDSNSDGVDDSYDTIVNESNDEADLRDLYVRAPQGATEGTIKLTIEPSSAASLIRVFNSSSQFILGAGPCDSDGVPTGPNLTEASIPVSAVNSWTQFHVEGVMRGVARVKASHVIGTETQVTDTVKVTMIRVLSGLPQQPGKDSGPVNLSVDNASLEYAALIDTIDETGTIVLAENGSTVDWQVSQGSAGLSASSSATSGGIASATVSAPTVFNGTFTLRSQLSQLKIGGSTFNITGPVQHTPQVITIPGEPWSVSVQPDTGLTYPASDRNRLRFMVAAVDKYGNPVADNTPYSIDFTAAAKLDLDITRLYFTNGTAPLGLTSGWFPETEQQLRVFVGNLEGGQTLSQVPVKITLYPSATTVGICSDDYVDITAQVIGEGNMPVQDGTEIVWITSLGSLSAVPPARTGPCAISTVVGGVTYVRLYTMPTDKSGVSKPNLERTGSAWVIASSGFSHHSKTKIEFFNPYTTPQSPQFQGVTSQSSMNTTPLLLSLDQHVLVGDDTVNGTMWGDDLSVELLVNIRNHLDASATACPECDLDDDGQITLVDLIRASGPSTIAPYYAQSTATISGDPGEVVTVYTSNPTAVELLGIQPDGTVTLDAAGQATFTVRSLGVLGDAVEFITVSVRRVEPEGGLMMAMSAGPCPDKASDVPVLFIPKVKHCFMYNFAAGALWGGGEGAASFAGDVTSSLAGVGDIRDVLVELFKMAPGGEDPDPVNYTMAVAGIATTVFPPGDAAIATIKAALRKLHRILPGAAGRKAIMAVVKKLMFALKEGMESFLEHFGKWRTYFTLLVENDEFLVRVAAHLDETLTHSCRNLMEKFGESFVGHITKAAAEVSTDCVRFAVRFMDTLDEVTIALIKNKPQAAQEAIVTGIAKCKGRRFAANAWKGMVDEVTLKKLLKPENLQLIENLPVGTGLRYSTEDLMSMIGRVAANEHGSERFDVFMREFTKRLESYRLAPSDPGAFSNFLGHLNELQELDRLVTPNSGFQLIEVTRKKQQIMLPNQAPVEVGEIDAVAKRVSDGKKVIFEFKRGDGLTRPGYTARQAHDGVADQVKDRIIYAKNSGGEFAEIRLRLNEPGKTWDPTLKAELEELGRVHGIPVIVE